MASRIGVKFIFQVSYLHTKSAVKILFLTYVGYFMSQEDRGGEVMVHSRWLFLINSTLSNHVCYITAI